MKRLLLLALCALPLAACDSDGSGPPDECLSPEGCPATRPDVYVVNQGNFAEGNGALAAYSPGSGRVDSTASLGSLLQSVTQGPDGRLYVTANTAGRVDVFELTDFLPPRVAQIAVESPRYVAFPSATTMYVTSQFYDRPSVVTVVDLATRQATGTVEVGGFAEGIAVTAGRAYVATGAFSASEEVVVISTATDAVVDRIDVGCAPRLVFTEESPVTPPSDVYVVCAGAPADEVVVLDGATGAEERRIAVGGTVSTAGPGQDAHLTSVGGAPTLFVARGDGAVVRVTLATGATAAIPLGSGDPVGAVAYDGVSERLYVARVPGFAAGGYVTVHDLTGARVGRFSSGGVVPSHFAFGPVAVP